MKAMHDRFEAAIDYSRKAGKLLLDYYHGAKYQQNLKPDYSVVTEADIAVDTFIASSISQSFSEDLILSEELTPHLTIRSAGSDGFLWIIDPLDGTTNFSLGLPIWGTSIACLYQGNPIFGVLFFPILEELYTTETGKGSFLNGEDLRIKQTSLPVSFFSCCSRTYQEYAISIPYKTRILGSACYSLCCVAKGSAIVGFEATPKIWDLAAGWLLVQEAGGVISTLDGVSPFPISDHIDYGVTSFPFIAAPNAKVHAKACQQINPKGK